MVPHPELRGPIRKKLLLPNTLGYKKAIRLVMFLLKTKKEKSNGNPQYFRFGLQGSEDSAALLLKNYPLKARNRIISSAQLAAANTILSNMLTGSTVQIRNFSNLKNHSFSPSGSRLFIISDTTLLAVPVS